MSSAPSPGSPRQAVRALAGFQDAATAAVTHWGGDFTVRQGLDITWMLAITTRDLWIAAASLRNFTVTAPPGNQPGSAAGKASRPARPEPGGLPGGNSQGTSSREIGEAARCLGRAAERAVTLLSRGDPGRRAVPGGGTRLGGDPRQDGPAVAAAHDMRNALGVATGTWAHLSGSDQDRDEIATQMLFAVDRLEAATLVLSRGGPQDTQAPLRWMAADLDSACFHLRESVACSLTGGYQPGTEGLARQLREAFPVLSEESPSASRDASRPGDEAPRLAATAFPHEAGTTATHAAEGSPARGAARNPRQQKRPGSPGTRP
jgi:hypothetical protein